MRPFQIFRAGRHTSSNGTSLSFSEDDLRAAVSAYDPALHEAPIVVGHPKDNGPAYGWVKALSFDEEGALVAEPAQVDESFAEMVQAGRFKKRSASFYTPDSPSNPKPGVFYLRHVGFLGAQAPAVKGLKDVGFADAEEGIVEFSDSGVVAGLFRRLRDFFLAEHGAEKADQVVPSFMVEDLEAEARREIDMKAAPSLPSFSEESSMTPEQIAEKDAALAAANARIAELEGAAAKVAEFSEREAALAEREAAIARKAIEVEVDDLVKAGKVLPAEKGALVAFMAALPEGEATIDFGEGDAATKVHARDFMRRFLTSRPKLVEYGERAGESRTGDPDALSDNDVAEKARLKVKAAKAEGKTLSFTEAVGQVRAELLAQ